MATIRAGNGLKGAGDMSRFIPVKRTAIDRKTWWVVYDLVENKYSSLLCFGRYHTRKACQWAIDNKAV